MPSRRPPKDYELPQTEEPDGELHPDLAAALEHHGPQGYARATAKHFRPGGKYNAKPRRRYAIT